MIAVDWSELASASAALSFPVLLGTLVYVAREFHRTKRLTEAQLLMDLRRLLREQNDVAGKLAAGGAYADRDVAVDLSGCERLELETYLGALDFGNALVTRNLVRRSSFDTFYAHRIDNAMQSATVRRLLDDDPETWVGLRRRAERH